MPKQADAINKPECRLVAPYYETAQSASATRTATEACDAGSQKVAATDSTAKTSEVVGQVGQMCDGQTKSHLRGPSFPNLNRRTPRRAKKPNLVQSIGQAACGFSKITKNILVCPFLPIGISDKIFWFSVGKQPIYFRCRKGHRRQLPIRRYAGRCLVNRRLGMRAAVCAFRVGRFRSSFARQTHGAVAKWLRQRIANPPSSVQLRPAPLPKTR
jgi:hypothetical protein